MSRIAPYSGVPKVVYGIDPVYTGISKRFHALYGINIGLYIEKVTKLNRHVEEGFDFVPWSATDLEEVIRRARFEHDVHEKHLGFIPSVGKIASLATHGQSFREPGAPSLHIAIAPDKCNVHLDNWGFKLQGYGPNAGQHTIDELLWQDIIVNKLLGRILPAPVIDFLHRFHPIVPNTQQIKPFSEIGVEFDVIKGRSRDLQRLWRVTFDVTHTCVNSSCDAWRKLNGKTVEGDNKVMVWFKVTGL